MLVGQLSRAMVVARQGGVTKVCGWNLEMICIFRG